MASSSSSSTFSGFNPPKYDVFLSFRGEDTRNYFTSHLYAALCRSNIKSFIDGFEVRKGDEISSSLSNAIQSSSLSIIVFSRNYATSSWCLKELLGILECNKTKGLVILPVFYHVSPYGIIKQMETYDEAFAKHEKSFNKMNDNFQKWRDALIEVANLSGWDLNQYDRYVTYFFFSLFNIYICFGFVSLPLAGRAELGHLSLEPQVKPLSKSIYFRLSISLQPSPIRINQFHLVLANHLNLVPLMAMEAHGLHLNSQILTERNLKVKGPSQALATGRGGHGSK
ncbi:hypothetical protein Dsin_016336 [Dipteronia sinensis]|uniref:TIR domain-containing protein n=1 Tax=Dipteronia sinensis TaxID=43782 RepID=A0AAE0AEA5_9ROSI|nr:hypothetical protein Dsin_016336 [Dipteronia sinensis]